MEGAGASGPGDDGRGDGTGEDAPATPEAVRLRLSESFARETDPAAILRVVAGTVGRYLGVSRVGYGEVEPGEPWITIPIDWTDGVPSMVGRHPLDRGSAMVRAYQAGRTLVVPDTDAVDATPAQRRLLADTRIRAFVGVPLIHDGELVAMFSANHHAPRAWSDEEVLAIQQTGARTWSALQHARTMEKLRRSEDEFRMLAENMPGICWLSGPEGQATWMNGKGLAYYGPLDGELMKAGAALHPDDRADALREWTEAQAAGRPVEVRVRLRGLDGGYRRFLARAAPVFDAAGAVVRWCGIQFDRTEEEARIRHDAFFRALADAVRTEADAGAVVDTATAMLREHLGAEEVAFCEADAPGLSPDPGGGVVPGVVAVPVVEDGRLAAVLRVRGAGPRAWTADERTLVEDVAERTWSTVTRARAEADLRQRERAQAFLLAWNDRVRGEGDPDRVVEATLEMLGRHLGATRVTCSRADRSLDRVTVSHDWSDGLPSTRGWVVTPEDYGAIVAGSVRGASVVRVADVGALADITEAARRACVESGTCAFIAAPMRRDDNAPFSISVQQDAPRAWTDAEVSLLADVAERCWSVLERARAEEEVAVRQREQAFLIAWSDAVRPLTDPDAILAVTLERLGQQLGASRATYSSIGIGAPVREGGGAGEGLYAIIAEWGPGEAPVLGYAWPASNLSDAVRGAYLAGEMVVTGDMARDDRFSAESRRRFAENGVAARIGVPLSRGGTVHAILAIDQNVPRAWGPAEVRLAGEVAERTWVLLERARAEQALKDRERDRAVLLDWSDRTRSNAAPELLLDMTLERLGRHLGVGRATYAESEGDGRRFAVLTEWREPDLPVIAGTSFSLSDLGIVIARDWQAGGVVRYDDVAGDPRVEDAVKAAYAAAGIAAFVSIALIQDGKVRSALSVQSAVPRRWRDGEVELLRDFAERLWIALGRARATAEVRRRERDRAFLLDWSDRLSGEGDPARIAAVTLERLGTHLGTARANLAEGAIAEGLFQVVAEWRRADERTRAPAGETRPAVSGGVHQNYVDGDVVAVEDVHADPRFDAAAAESYAAVDAVSFLGVPMLRGGRVQAVLSVQQATRRAWAPSEVQLLRDVANRFWVLLDRARAQAELGRSREALYQTEKLSALGSLLAGVSHELNNPLSIVVAQAVMMERQSKGTELADRAFKIRRAADRCARIVQTFLAMARQKRPERRPTDLNRVAAAAVELMHYGFRSDGVEVTQRFDGELPRIAADEDQLHQIIVNLLVNAQQAMGDWPGERRVTLSTGFGPEPRTVVLEVADTGPGVPEEARRRIFEPFYTTKPQGEGTGVGLSFSQGLAEAHGGRLALMPGDGGAGAPGAGTGATFRLTLPIEDELRLPGAEPEPAAPAGSRARALVIDDEAEIAESLADFLALEGYACEVAVGGAAGRARLAAGDWDLIVSDLRMPDIDGPALHAFVCAERPELAARMAFTTGDTLGAAAARFLEQVRRPVLEKPFVPEGVRRFLAEVRAG